MRSQILGVLGGAVMAAATIGSAQAESWLSYTFLPSPTMDASVAMLDISNAVGEITDGRITVALNYGGSLSIPNNGVTQAVGEGIVQMADDAFFSGNVELGGILGLPLLFRSFEEYSSGLEIVLPTIEKSFLEQGVVVLGHYSYPAQVLFTTGKMTGLDDYQGMKVRPTSPEQSEFIRKFGGTPVTMSTSEVASALQTGVIGGVMTASVSGGRIWRDQVKYNYRLPMNYVLSLVTINEDAFAQLSEEEQQKLREFVTERLKKLDETQLNSEAETTKQFVDTGMTVTEPTEEDFDRGIEAMQPYWDEWATTKGKETQDVLAKVRQALGR